MVLKKLKANKEAAVTKSEEPASSGKHKSDLDGPLKQSCLLTPSASPATSEEEASAKARRSHAYCIYRCINSTVILVKALRVLRAYKPVVLTKNDVSTLAKRRFHDAG